MTSTQQVLGLACSPRLNGNTKILVEEALDGAKDVGAETELLTTADKVINPCDGCGACRSSGECHIKDDMQGIYNKLVKADGIILGSPVHFVNISAQAKLVIDRTYMFGGTRKLKDKVGGAIVATRRTGGSNVLSYLYTFFLAHRMLVAGGTIGYGAGRGEVREGPGIWRPALEEARAVGKRVGGLIGKA